MHVLDSAEASLERGRQNDDRNLRTLLAQAVSDLRAKLSCAQMVVEHRDVDIVQPRLSFFNRARSDCLIAVLAQNSCAQKQIVSPVVEKQDTYWAAAAAGLRLIFACCRLHLR